MGGLLGGDSSRSTRQSEGSTQARESKCSTSPRLFKVTASPSSALLSSAACCLAAPSPPTSHNTAPHWWCVLPPCRDTPVGGRQCRRPRQYPLPSRPPPVLPAALWMGWGKGKGVSIPFQLVTPLPVSSVFTSLVLLLTKLIISTRGGIGFQVVYTQQQQNCLAPSTLRHALKAPGLVNNYIVYR